MSPKRLVLQARAKEEGGGKGEGGGGQALIGKQNSLLYILNSY